MNCKKEIFEKYEIRKSKKQKDDFIKYVTEFVENKGFNTELQKGSFGSRNIIIGDVSKADVVFTAHYDTCAVMPIPNFITPTNVFIYLLYQILLMIIIIMPGLGITFLIDCFFNLNGEAFFFIFYMFFMIMLLLLMVGPANKHTANDNTSGVITVLELINVLPDNLKNKVAFVLFDLEEAGLFGSSAFASKYKAEMKDKLLINFDCVSDGEKMLFIFNKKARKHFDLLNNAYRDDGVLEVSLVTKGAFYPSDQAHFNCGIGVCAVLTSKKYNIDYIDKIHTKNDVVFRDENIDYLVKHSVELIKNLEK